MSIGALILDWVARKALFPVLPKARGEPVRRALFVTESLNTVLNSPEGSIEWEQRVAELRADLEVFVTSRTINPKYLFLLYPARDAVWEIRSIRDDPSIRVLGLFAQRDVFIATNLAFRSDLGGWQSREWKAVKRTARAQWRRFFLSYDPVRGYDVKKLVTGALDGKYFKIAAD
jgi:hypothetical protein